MSTRPATVVFSKNRKRFLRSCPTRMLYRTSGNRAAVFLSLRPMRLILTNPRGFCAGVHMAIDVVDQVLDLYPGRAIYVFHEIVHNKHVVDRFKHRGVKFVEEVSEVPE